MKVKVVDVMASGQIKERASVLQSKTQKPMRFEISEGTRVSVDHQDVALEARKTAMRRACRIKAGANSQPTGRI